jgi:transcriptional regulator with XRE-family HTH domain
MRTTDFPCRFRLVRIAMGLSSEEMAHKLQHSIGTQRSYETGERTPRLFRMREIADTLEVPMEWLMGRGRTFAWEESHGTR